MCQFIVVKAFPGKLVFPEILELLVSLVWMAVMELTVTFPTIFLIACIHQYLNRSYVSIFAQFFTCGHFIHLFYFSFMKTGPRGIPGLAGVDGPRGFPGVEGARGDKGA